MRRILVLLCVFLGFYAAAASSAFGQNLHDLSEKFYSGLAGIIERNMDNPANCVREVDAYYRNNQALIKQIRSETAKAMQRIAPMVQEYMQAIDGSMSGSDFDEAKLRELDSQMGAYRTRQPSGSPAIDRYSKAIEAFSKKHPQYGMKIAMRAMELMPDMQAPSY